MERSTWRPIASDYAKRSLGPPIVRLGDWRVVEVPQEHTADSASLVRDLECPDKEISLVLLGDISRVEIVRVDLTHRRSPSELGEPERLPTVAIRVHDLAE